MAESRPDAEPAPVDLDDPGLANRRGRESETAEGIDLAAIDGFLEREPESLAPAEEAGFDPDAFGDRKTDAIARMTRKKGNQEAAESASPESREPEPQSETETESTVARKRSLPKGAVRISLTKDRMRATLKVRPNQARGLTFDTVMTRLAKAKIRHGVEEDAIIELTDHIPELAESEVAIAVAVGTPAVAGTPVEIHIPALGDEPVSEETLERLGAVTALLEKWRESGECGSVDASCTGLPLVCPGEVAVSVTPALQGTEGTDVCGRRIPVEEVSEEVPIPGPGLQPDDDRREYTASEYGYLGFGEESGFEVVSPLQPTSDWTAVVALDLGTSNEPLDAASVLAGLQAMGVVDPPPAEQLSETLAGGDRERPRVITVSEATQPRPGRDASIDMCVEVGPRAGVLREDGSIDLRERNFATNVEPDQLLATKIPSEQGAAGVDVRGGEIAVAAPKDMQLEAGEGVERVEEDGQLRFYARQEGSVHHSSGVLEVRQELQVAGDVNADTGNIECRGDLIVSGTVRGGFTVKATGDVVVAEGVENGARIRAGRSVTVSKGLFGDKTRVSAPRDITCQFVQDAALLCGGDVDVGSYIYNASVRAGGAVRVHGRGDHGGIVGGRVVAAREIATSMAGSEFGTVTQLVVGVDEKLIRSRQKIEQAAAYCQRSTEQIKEELGVTSTEPKVIWDALNHTPASQRKHVRKLVQKLEKLVAMAENIKEHEQALAQKETDLAAAARIQVEGTVFHKVDLHIGCHHHRVVDAIKGAAYGLDADDVLETTALRPQPE